MNRQQASRGGKPVAPLLIVAGLAVLSALPVLLATYPQMTDYPAHLARWHVMLDSANSPALAAHYNFVWQWTPNLAADMLIRPLAALFGLETGGRIIAALAPILLAAAILAAEWTLKRRVGVGALLALATVWSPSLLMGFLNFTLALSLALLAFCLWLRLEGSRLRAPVFAVIAPLIWLCHLSGWGVLCVLVFGYEWHRRGLIRAIPVTWPLWPPALLSLFAGAGTHGALTYGDDVLRDKLTNWVMGLRDGHQLVDMWSVALLAALPLLAWRKGLIDGRIGRAALLLAALSFVIPRHLGGGDFADYRLVPVALACGCLAIDWPGEGRAVSRWALALAALPFLLRLGLTTAAWQNESRETEEILGALAHVPQGAVIAGAWAEPSFAWHQAPFGHVFNWATVRRDALTNAHFAIPGVHMLQLARPDAGFVDPSQRILLAPGEVADLAAFAPARRAQYLWYVGDRPPLHRPLGAEQVYASNHSILLRLAKAAPSR